MVFRAYGVQGLQHRVGGEGRAGDGLDAVLAVGEGASLADELPGELGLGGQLAEALGLVRGLHGQVGHGPRVVQAGGDGDVAREALGAGGHGGTHVGLLRLLEDAQLGGCDVAGDVVHAAQHRAAGDGGARHAVHAVGILALVELDPRSLALELADELRLPGQAAEAGGLVEALAPHVYTGDDALAVHTRGDLHGSAVAGDGGLPHVAHGLARAVQGGVDLVHAVAAVLKLQRLKLLRVDELRPRQIVGHGGVSVDLRPGRAVDPVQHQRRGDAHRRDRDPCGQFLVHMPFPLLLVGMDWSVIGNAIVVWE